MMSKDFWAFRIRETLVELADITYQKRVWLGHSTNEVSSFVEAVCHLYDDYDLRGFLSTQLEDRKNKSEILQAFGELRKAVDAVNESWREAEIVESPEMEVVRKLASQALALLDENA